MTFKGTPTKISGHIDLAARQARLGDILAQRTNFDGRYALDSQRGVLSLLGDYGSNSVALAPAMTASITDPLESAQGTPLGPIAAAISQRH